MTSSITPVRIGKTRITDPLSGAYVNMVAEKVIPCQWEALNDRIPGVEKGYCIENFRVAAGLQPGHHRGAIFQDTDLYKWLEAAATSLKRRPMCTAWSRWTTDVTLQACSYPRKLKFPRPPRRKASRERFPPCWFLVSGWCRPPVPTTCAFRMENVTLKAVPYPCGATGSRERCWSGSTPGCNGKFTGFFSGRFCCNH